MAAVADLPTIDPDSARLYALVARTARRAVVFRRGPSKRVRMLVWNLASDTLEPGQWVKGRVYERRCDLSPDGEFVACFVANHRQPYYAWTTISRPPFFTALQLWPKGDCWGGGGLFESGAHFRLNHRPGVGAGRGLTEMGLAPGFAPARRLRVEPLGEASGWGEDDPIRLLRMIREGWADPGRPSEAKRHGEAARFWVTFEPPRQLRKPLAKQKKRAPLFLCLNTHAVLERQGRWLVETATIESAEGAVARELGRVDFAELDHNGDALYGADGKLWRLPAPQIAGSVPRIVADLNDMTFEAIEPTAEARRPM
ncbi:MAG: hypothetical protein JNK46_14665 [Methylobacteriaceae bacterium]|nr:hypothetical protein [Methylobacteriaceae bacterium]